ncbi:hypothetical protein PENSTE_c006G05151 [Penicillium steckii]|uniref:Uncharacterized protein n=1 Tax=Penicillium steckii TaxID=303698 RepID=A0A1V6TGK9_9EURO|nr:hypothetical protein PENSTE_c006G05151 [Penicillium steckii]
MSNRRVSMDLLPNEILLMVAYQLNEVTDINALAQVNRRFFNTLNQHLYRCDALFGPLDALYYAARNGNGATAQMSINASFDCDHQIDSIQQALYDATDFGSADVVSCILQRDDIDPTLALNGAARGGHTAIVRHLLSCKDLDPNPKHPSDQSPLSIAAFRAHADVVELLLDMPNIEADFRDSLNRSPLFYAVLSNSPKTVSCFLRRNLNLDVNVEDKMRRERFRHNLGRTPLIVASLFKLPDILNLLITIPGISINHSDSRGKTALHFAAELGTEPIVRSLLEHGADPDPKDNEKETPLFLAAKNGSESVVRILLEAGANPNHTCDNQVHALGAARTEGHRDVAQIIHDFDKLDLDSLGPVPRHWNAARGKMWSASVKSKPDGHS